MIAMVVDQLGAIARDYSNSGGENIIYFDALTHRRIRLIKIGLSLEGPIYII